jgi:hypothetical protein
MRREPEERLLARRYIPKTIFPKNMGLMKQGFSVEGGASLE